MPYFFDQPIVSNTGPLLGLSRIGRIDILGRMFPQVIVPREVADELLLTPYADVDDLRRELERFTITIAATTAEPLLEAELDVGEAAVIATASARGSLPVLMDERKGRRVASIIYRLPVIGTGGLLVAAKRLGLVSTIRPLLEGMRSGGYHLGPTLVAECLRRAGE